MLGDDRGLTRGFSTDEAVAVCGGKIISQGRLPTRTIDEGISKLEALSMYTNVVFTEILYFMSCVYFFWSR